METVETIINKLIENGSYEMVGIEYHDHIIYFGSLESLRRTLGYYLLECKVDSTPIMKNDPTYLCVITIKDGELDKWKKQLIKIKLNSLYGNHAYKGDVKNKVYFPTPVLFINYLLKHILLYADTDSVITIKEGKWWNY